MKHIFEYVIKLDWTKIVRYYQPKNKYTMCVCGNNTRGEILLLSIYAFFCGCGLDMNLGWFIFIKYNFLGFVDHRNLMTLLKIFRGGGGSS